MIKFFRKIRQNLLSEGKAMQYFKYAIGEIILVVIGILIALQINNWNENRQAKRLVSSHLASIREDLKLDLKQIETNAESLKTHEEATLNIKDFLDDKNLLIDSTKLSKGFMLLHLFREFSPTKTAYQNFVNIGGTGLIKNKRLAKLLTAYHFEAPFNIRGKNQRARLSDEYDAFRIKYIKSGMLRGYLEKQIFGNSDFKEEDYQVDWNNLRKDIEYRHLLDQLLAMRVPQRFRLGVAKNALNELNEEIDREINSQVH